MAHGVTEAGSLVLSNLGHAETVRSMSCEGRRRVAAYFVLTLLLTAGTAGMSNAAPDQPMTFRIQSGGNCGNCAWLLAEGNIVSDTPHQFATSLERIRQASSGPHIIRLNSNGGNLVAAMELGRKLRALKLDTAVGFAMVRHYEKDAPGSPQNPDSPQASNCYSACVYAFLGGINRLVGPRIPSEDNPTESKLGIHQFYGPDALTDPGGKAFSAVDAAAMQKLSATLTAYVREMGVDPRLVELAAQISPWEPILILTKREIIDLHITTDSPESEKWTMKVSGNGVIAFVHQAIYAHKEVEISFYCKRPEKNRTLLRVDTFRSFYERAMVKDLNDLRLSNGDYFKVDGSSIGNGNVQFSRVVVEKYGVATFFVLLTNDAVTRVLRGHALEVVVTEPTVVGNSLGGTVSLEGAAESMPIALKNCIR